jgi:hypothetical protein
MTMGRAPLGHRAMTDAERQRRRRRTLEEKAISTWKPEWSPESRRRWLTEDQFLDRLRWWLEDGNEEEIAQYFADHLYTHVGRWERIVERATAIMVAAEARAILEAKHREGWLHENPDKDPLDYPGCNP